MITIEGIGGKGALWSGIKFGNSQAVLPTDVTNACSNVRLITPASPFECVIPPTGGKLIWYDCTLTPYGPIVTEVAIGTLIGIKNSPTTPNPCQHTTMKGSLLYTGPDHASIPKWKTNFVLESTGWFWYDTDRVKRRFTCGRPNNSLYTGVYNRYGDIVSFSRTLDNVDLWSGYFTGYTDWCDPAGSSIPYYANGAKAGEWHSSIPDWDVNFLNPTIFFRQSCKHVSDNVWVEEWDTEYHHNASYVPQVPLGHADLGYVVCSTRRRLTHKMTFIQAIDNVTFKARFTCTEEVEYWGHKPQWPIAKYYEGSTSAVYSYTSTIGIMEPGKSLSFIFDPKGCDAYCKLAPIRAKDIYEGSAMKTARSLAISDVTGLDSNWIENLSQVKGTASVIRPILDGYKAVKRFDLKAAKRALSGAYLAYCYSVAPAIKDYHDVKDNGGNVVRSFTKYRFSNERRRGKVINTCPVLETLATQSYFVTLHLQLKDNNFSSLWNALDKLGLDPSVNNIWDLIPFSFVVDWFLEIGPCLDGISAYTNSVLTQNVKSRIQTYSVQWPLSKTDLLSFGLEDFSISDSLDYSWYDRRIMNGIGSFDPFAGQSNDGVSASQMTQGAALLTSFKK